MLIGIRGTMRLRFLANLAVLFSFGFSALLASPAQFRQYSGEEDKSTPQPRDEDAGIRGFASVLFRSRSECKTLRANHLRRSPALIDDFHGTITEVS
jgi:hypothetical protein